MKNALDCVTETTCGCRLNFTLWSLRLPAPRRRHDYTICIHAPQMHRDCAFRRQACRGKFTFRSRHDRSVTKRSRSGDNGRAPVFSFISNDGKERSLRGVRYMQPLPFLLLFETGYRRRRSRRKIAYELNRSHTPLAKIEFARSFRQRRDEFVEA